MLVTPPPDTLGAANLASVLNAILTLLMASACVLAFWALVALYVRLKRLIQSLGQRLSRHLSQRRYSPRRWSITDVLMTPLALDDVDLAVVRTFPTVQQVTPLAEPPAVESALEPMLTATLPKMPSTPPSSITTPPPEPIVSGSSSVALLDNEDDDEPWPPFRPGSKRYRYVLASGQLVRLATLKPFTIGMPRWFELN